MTEEAKSTAVRQAVRDVNQAWINARYERLRELIDPDIVLATPGFGERVHGAEAYLSGHREFVESATIHSFAEDEIDVDILGSSAVATYRYRLDYERSGQRYESTGRDLFVFESTDGRWRAMWRTILDIDEQAR